MKRAIWVSVAVIIAATVLLVFGARSLLVDDQPPGEPVAVDKQVPQRPDCPAGLDLPCLGGDVAGDAKEITVVNVWAWWCQPCRAELPAVEEFARTHPEYTVVGVHADRNAGNGAALLEDLGVGLPSYQDDSGAFAAAQGLPPVVPVTVVLRGGEQVAVFAREFTSADELAEAVEGAV
ncbi:TlpA family protein disulfide reductase [Corynebacterium afermentans subsp. lipophilum]|uniref:TlpA family protein disulfide reductase n=1 Tax=Corynebacterium afermentans TaxID=38286 RepID=UPI00188D3A01|nr:TlpA disulfide reductase family protein [Corynebacterium afermentans]MBF4547388.1 TlpA family protein disulfide reductase [Corynebacterium afermentans subsp. lipophilum]WJY57948.1 thiol-disulfide oxidoreductase [Corynebacterium afermentans subsp. lipophilum]